MDPSNLPLPIGVLGGTFDPIHYGHLRFAQDARTQLRLVEVRLVPAGEPPHRARPWASAEDRLAMAKLGAAEFVGVAVDDYEVRRREPSYTVVTLEHLRGEVGAAPLCLLLGADALAGLNRWHRWRDLFELAHLVVAERPGSVALATLPAEVAQEWATRRAVSADKLCSEAAGGTFLLPIRPHLISATDLRDRLAAGERPSDLLPPSVLAYIDLHRLYRNN